MLCVVEPDVSYERVASVFRVERIREQEAGYLLASRTKQATRSSEPSVSTRPTRRLIPQDGALYQSRNVRQYHFKSANCFHPLCVP
jgi:hypothetical protein